jgi:2-dehydro-3-deoxyphosphogluconate aldolase/(4S)-4-hydroxy-2-oxoglutarate aldolase
MARFDRLSVYNTLLGDGLVPLFYHGSVETSVGAANAIAQGGGHVLEFTNRGDFALEVFSALVKQCAKTSPDLIIGVGSVEDAPTAALFIAHGANFVVGPSFDAETARLCNRHKVGYVPGCATVTEIATAEEYGVEIVKIFPGETIGGPDFVKAVLAPRPWSRLMPTGGVTPEADNLRAWFGAGVAAVGMGSRLIRGDWMKNSNFDAIRDGMAATLELVRAIRAEKH